MNFKSVSSLINVVICGVGLLLQTAPRAPEELVWFSVGALSNGKLGIDPIAKVADHKLVDIPDACAENDFEYSSFANRFMKPGQSYDVLFGGTLAGTVILGKNDSPGYALTPARYNGLSRPHGHVQVIAASSTKLTNRPRVRQTPSENERTSALQLARKLFEQAGISKSLLEKMAVENLTRTVVAPATIPSIIGSFRVPSADFKSSGAAYNLFFIASARANDLEPELVWTNLPQGEAGVESQQLVDQADLLADGQDEIVTEIYYYENWSYVVYRRAKDGVHWDKILETHIRGCL